MNKNDIKRKLCSRKFWAAIVAFVTGLLIYFGRSETEAAQIAALIMSGASVMAYIIGEGLADAAGAQADVVWLPDEEKPPEEYDTYVGDE